MYYSIRHKTRLRYSAPVSESFTELRMHPRNEGIQRCLEFSITTSPPSQVFSYRDYLGNIVHHFDIPTPHRQLVINAEALVVFREPEPAPSSLDVTAWHAIDELSTETALYDFLIPSRFTAPTALLRQLASEIGADRRDDPLTVVRRINKAIFELFAYTPQSTRVDSPIDEALHTRKGVCQDFTHIMTALVRGLGIPCRYVSGYLFHRLEDHDRSAEDATHAWVEALLPPLGWVGFDPTNDLIAAERHIRTAVGRDYADVPPTRGVYRGDATNSIEVGVRVLPTDAPPRDEEPELTLAVGSPPIPSDNELQQMQAQQQ